MPRPVTHDSHGHPLCQECSDVIADDERRVRVPAGTVHEDCWLAARRAA